MGKVSQVGNRNGDNKKWEVSNCWPQTLIMQIVQIAKSALKLFKLFELCYEKPNLRAQKVLKNLLKNSRR